MLKLIYSGFGLLLFTACSFQRKLDKKMNSKSYNSTVYKIGSQMEKFDTNFFDKMIAQKTELSKKAGKRFALSHESYEEYDTANNLQKHFFRGIGGNREITGYDYSANSVMGVNTEFYSDGNMKVKGLYCWFGFKVGVWYTYNDQGNLNDSIDYDAEYTFTYSQVFDYCDKHNISLEKKSNGYRITIIKNKSANDKPAWLIRYINMEKSVFNIVQLNGSTGEAIMTKEIPLPQD